MDRKKGEQRAVFCKFAHENNCNIYIIHTNALYIIHTNIMHIMLILKRIWLTQQVVYTYDLVNIQYTLYNIHFSVFYDTLSVQCTLYRALELICIFIVKFRVKCRM